MEKGLGRSKKVLFWMKRAGYLMEKCILERPGSWFRTWRDRENCDCTQERLRIRDMINFLHNVDIALQFLERDYWKKKNKKAISGGLFIHQVCFPNLHVPAHGTYPLMQSPIPVGRCPVPVQWSERGVISPPDEISFACMNSPPVYFWTLLYITSPVMIDYMMRSREKCSRNQWSPLIPSSSGETLIGWNTSQNVKMHFLPPFVSRPTSWSCPE